MASPSPTRPNCPYLERSWRYMRRQVAARMPDTSRGSSLPSLQTASMIREQIFSYCHRGHAGTSKRRTSCDCRNRKYRSFNISAMEAQRFSYRLCSERSLFVELISSTKVISLPFMSISACNLSRLSQDPEPSSSHSLERISLCRSRCLLSRPLRDSVSLLATACADPLAVRTAACSSVSATATWSLSQLMMATSSCAEGKRGSACDLVKRTSIPPPFSTAQILLRSPTMSGVRLLTSKRRFVPLAMVFKASLRPQDPVPVWVSTAACCQTRPGYKPSTIVAAIPSGSTSKATR